MLTRGIHGEKLLCRIHRVGFGGNRTVHRGGVIINSCLYVLANVLPVDDAKQGKEESDREDNEFSNESGSTSEECYVYDIRLGRGEQPL